LVKGNNIYKERRFPSFHKLQESCSQNKPLHFKTDRKGIKMKTRYLSFLILSMLIQLTVAQKQPNKVNAVQQAITVDQLFEDGISRVQQGSTVSQVKHWDGSGWPGTTVPAVIILTHLIMKQCGEILHYGPIHNQFRKSSLLGCKWSRQCFEPSGYSSNCWQWRLEIQIQKSVQRNTPFTINRRGGYGSLRFNDPWLIDNTDAKGKLNRG